MKRLVLGILTAMCAVTPTIALAQAGGVHLRTLYYDRGEFVGESIIYCDGTSQFFGRPGPDSFTEESSCD
ncbi:hypothetical protein NZL82_11015 [Sphingomonas sanguinis]|uniref:hypothetical protein n=1 Tax=Sphingomonas sp. LC-1 TaxID=3110957 RepID=UPI0021BB153B|nr:hypothetical protein [Sphingomonas sp. LC-1]MCT8002408.1 hypothetical protein [Sphingomonas sp. LC-1]